MSERTDKSKLTHHGSKQVINGQDIESRLANLPTHFHYPPLPDLVMNPGEDNLPIGKPTLGDLKILEDKRHEYVWHMAGGYEFGLKGIVGWTLMNDSWIFFDDEGVALVCDKEMKGFFMPRPEKDEATVSLDPAVKANTGNAPEKAQDASIQEGKDHAERYILRVRADKSLEVFDNDSGQATSFVEGTKNDLEILVRAANLGSDAERTAEFLSGQASQATVSIHIIDKEDKPSAVVSGEMFQRMIGAGEYTWVQAPIVRDKAGQHYRVHQKEELISLVQASLDIRAPSDLTSGPLEAGNE